MSLCVCVCARLLNCVRLLETPWAVAHQAPLSMELSRQEDWSGLPFPPPGDLPDPGIEPKSPVRPALAGRFFTTVPPGKPLNHRTTRKSLKVFSIVGYYKIVNIVPCVVQYILAVYSLYI